MGLLSVKGGFLRGCRWATTYCRLRKRLGCRGPGMDVGMPFWVTPPPALDPRPGTCLGSVAPLPSRRRITPSRWEWYVLSPFTTPSRNVSERTLTRRTRAD